MAELAQRFLDAQNPKNKDMLEGNGPEGVLNAEATAGTKPGPTKDREARADEKNLASITRDLETVQSALASLEDPNNQEIDENQMGPALVVAQDVINNSNLSMGQKNGQVGTIVDSLEDLNEETNRNFIIDVLIKTEQQLQAQQQQLQAAPVASAIEITAQEANGANALQEMFEDEAELKAQGLQYTPDENGNGGTLTPILKDGKSDPSYSAHFTFGEKGMTATITGENPQAGVKDVLDAFEKAGITAVDLSGPGVETDKGAYETLKMALASNEKVTPVLAGKSILESAQSFANGAAEANPGKTEDNDKATKGYLEKIAGNEKLCAEMIGEMAKGNAEEEKRLKELEPKELAEEAFKSITPPKVEAKVEAKPPQDKQEQEQDVELDTEKENETGNELDTGAGPEPQEEQKQEQSAVKNPKDPSSLLTSSSHVKEVEKEVEAEVTKQKGMTSQSGGSSANKDDKKDKDAENSAPSRPSN